MHRSSLLLCGALLRLAPCSMNAQSRGVAELHALVQGLTVTPRVLLVGASPRDANADLIAWLARGHQVQTAYLSLTRGESAPNFTGLESGATRGAIRVQETLEARAIDGGEQYFTRAFDFGPARDTAEVFREWDRTTLLGDAVAIVRAFRPQVIISLSALNAASHDGQREVAALIARDVFSAAADTVHFPVGKFGMPWLPQSVFEPGSGITIDARDFDRILGRTYAEIARESRSQLRSFGFLEVPWSGAATTELRRVATRASDSLPMNASVFSGIDTTFFRLQRQLPQVSATLQRPLITQLAGIAAYADSARTHLDLSHPANAAPYLREVIDLASAARILLRSCRHPARDAAAALSNTKCESQWLDLDASLDLVLRRASDALMIATGVRFSAVSDREFLAGGDTALVTVTVFNHGTEPIVVNDVAVTGSIPVRMTLPIRISPRDSAVVQRSVVNAAYAHPWWIFKRQQNFYPQSITALDGVPRPAIFMRDFGISSVAVPENIRRLSDVTVTLTSSRTTVTLSTGSAVFRTADPALGVRDRAMSGTPAATILFDRALIWAQAGKPLRKPVSAVLRSFSDKPQRIALKPADADPRAIVRIDSLPGALILAPRESREVTPLLRGAPQVKRYDLGLTGLTTSDTLQVGFRTAQYSYLAPIHLFRDAVISVQSVDVEIPRRLSVAYLRGAGEETDMALKDLGVPVYLLNSQGLARFEFEAISTVVIGPDALRTDPGILTLISRLMDFARKGGTVVIMNNAETIAQHAVLPFPVHFPSENIGAVLRSDAPVSLIDVQSRVLTWPNAIRQDDWSNWVGARALMTPTTADPRFAQPVEMHDGDQAGNRSTILVGQLGKGRVIYSSLTLTDQIANAVPGAMRLLVNLLSAGLAPEGASTGP